MAERVVVLGMAGDRATGPVDELASATLVVGARRHLGAVGLADEARAVPVGGDDGALGEVLDHIEGADGPVVVLASGDPGFFGIVRILGERLGPERLSVHPAPSAVSLAFARLGVSWDDATVVSAHGRRLGDAVDAAAGSAKVAVLTSPDNPPEIVGRALLDRGAPSRRVVVCSDLGHGDERVVETDLAGLAAGTWDPLSVTVLLAGDGVAEDVSLAWGRTEQAFAHRARMVTKSEVRAVVLARLGLLPSGGGTVMWDVGAGSGSVAIEAKILAPGLRVAAVERRSDDCARIEANASASGVRVEVVEGEAPSALEGLPDPDRAFVGGGGLGVLRAVLGRLRPGGRIVATYAALDRAVEAYRLLGSMSEVAVARAEPLADSAVRLAAENPVFVVWGSR